MPKEYQRTDRVADGLQKEIARIIQRDLRDPRLSMVTVMSVEVSRDLSYAKVFVSVLGDEAQVQETLATLKRAKGHIRSLLAKRITLRIMPDLNFIYDDSVTRGTHVSHLIDEATERDETIKRTSHDESDESKE